MEIGERITYLREQKGLTIISLAEKSGLSESCIQSVIHGRKTPTLRTLEQISEVLDISVKDLFADELPDAKLDPVLREGLYKLSKEQKERLGKFLETLVF